MRDALLKLAIALIERPSITPDDAGCQDLIGKRLAQLGFKLQSLPFGKVSNLWATHGDTSPLFVFAGHTDVVPPGPMSAWSSNPFSPILKGDTLYGRGAADMKGSLAAMILAVVDYLADNPKHLGTIGLLLTSDEEGPAIDGTQRVICHLYDQGIDIKWCIVGEPSSQNLLGDTIKNGRRGSLNAVLQIKGKQGHIAYPEYASNPIHMAAQFVADLCAIEWDQGDEDFPPTSLQISNIQAGAGAENVIPERLTIQFNFRYGAVTTAASLKERIEALLAEHNLDYELDWRLSGEPFLTQNGALITATKKAIADILGYVPNCSTSGGTSDGRFIAPMGVELVELGPINDSIHQIDEHVSLSDLVALTHIYRQILAELL